MFENLFSTLLGQVEIEQNETWTRHAFVAIQVINELHSLFPVFQNLELEFATGSL